MLDEFGLEVEHENDSLISPHESSQPQLASFSNSNGRSSHNVSPLNLSSSTPSKEQRSLLASTNIKYTKLRISPTQRPRLLKMSLLVILLATAIVLFNMGEEESIDEAIVPEDTELKPEKSYHLLRPKANANNNGNVQQDEDEREFVAPARMTDDEELYKSQ